jgi:flagellar motor switch protein FliN/FliY
MSEQTPAIAALLESLASAVAAAVAALSGATASPVSVEAPEPSEWLVRISAAGAITGELQVGFSDADARRLAGLLMGLDGEEITDDTVTDALQEISNQAIATVGISPEASAVKLSNLTVAKASFGGAPAASFAFQLPNEFVLAVALGTSGVSVTAVDPTPAAAVPPETLGAATPTMEIAAAPAAPTPRNLDLLLDIELPLAVRFGQTELTLNTLTRLGPGSVIDLHRSADEPVEILVGGKMIARGEVVVVEGNYGVRVTEVLSTADRIRSLGA